MPVYIHFIKCYTGISYEPCPNSVYIRYTPAYVRRFVCDTYIPRAVGQINSSHAGVHPDMYMYMYTSWPWFIYLHLYAQICRLAWVQRFRGTNAFCVSKMVRNIHGIP